MSDLYVHVPNRPGIHGPRFTTPLRIHKICTKLITLTSKVERQTGVKENNLVSDVLTCLAFLFVTATLSFFLYKVNSLGNVMIKVYPNFLYIYGLHLLSPAIIAITFCTLLYSRNSAMRTAIFKEIKEYY